VRPTQVTFAIAAMETDSDMEPPPVDITANVPSDEEAEVTEPTPPH